MLFTQNLCITMRACDKDCTVEHVWKVVDMSINRDRALMYPPKWYDAYIPEQSVFEDTSLGAHF